MPGPINKNEIDLVAAQISTGPLGLVEHKSESWANPSCCFQNTWRKVELSGGATRYGWTFHSRIKEGLGDYFFVTHHAVWHSPDGRLVDVTPFHGDPKHHPLIIGTSIVFLVDGNAMPVVKGAVVAPLPLRFFPRSDSPMLAKYVDEMNTSEQQRLKALIENLDRQCSLKQDDPI